MRQRIMFFCMAFLMTGCSSQSAQPIDFDQFAEQLWQALQGTLADPRTWRITGDDKALLLALWS